jgi:hypothetical protein
MDDRLKNFEAWMFRELKSGFDEETGQPLSEFERGYNTGAIGVISMIRLWEKDSDG